MQQNPSGWIMPMRFPQKPSMTIALGIHVEYSVPNVHTQNGLDEYLIKIIKLIARLLLYNCKLPTSYHVGVTCTYTPLT